MENEVIEVHSANELALSIVKILMTEKPEYGNEWTYSSSAVAYQKGKKPVKRSLTLNEYLKGYYAREDVWGIISLIREIESGSTRLDKDTPIELKYFVALKHGGKEHTKEIIIDCLQDVDEQSLKKVIGNIERFMEINGE